MRTRFPVIGELAGKLDAGTDREEKLDDDGLSASCACKTGITSGSPEISKKIETER
jgi:hypothetical protein